MPKLKIKKLAEAQAKANTILARSITKELINYNAIKQWNGAYPQTLMSGDKSGVLLNLPGK